MKLILQITVPDSNSEFRQFENASQLTIGRSEKCEVSLPLLSDVSRQHAKLEWIQGHWQLTDLSSSFGTFVNETRINQPTRVSTQDVIRIGGNVEICLRDEQAVNPPQRPAAHPPIKPPGAPPIGQSKPQTVPKVPQTPASSAVRIGPPPEDYGATPWHVGLGLLTAVVSLLILLVYSAYTQDNPKRGYTFLGMTTGIIGSFLLGIVGFYAARKRVLQEKLPWRLLTWLRWHLWLSVIGIWMIAIHAGFHLDGGSGTWTVLLLLATVGTGAVGWFQYKKVPGTVTATVGNLATNSVKKQIQEIDRQIEDQLAGRDTQISGPIRKAREDVETGKRAHDEIPWNLLFENPSCLPFLDQVKTLTQQKADFLEQLGQQQRLHKSMRGWLWLHIPASILFGVLFAWHVFDATEMRVPFTAAGPREYADSLSCAECHQQQYDEWIGSMHAIAMTSPVTELQNNLVVKKDRVDDGVHGVRVGQLCIECHAPTSVKGNFWEKEDLLATHSQRSPSSQFGVSCVACHQISDIHKTVLFAGDSDPRYQNAAGMEYHDGGTRTMLGPLSESGSIAGNSAHKGKYGKHFKEASFCASCHTVQVPVNDGEKVVTLQNTYEEWLEGSPSNNSRSSADINWSQLGDKGINCNDCHAKPLDSLVDLAQEMQSDRDSLSDRIETMTKAVIRNTNADLPDDQYAASPTNGFDRPLADKRTHLHTFVGVDYHLNWPDKNSVSGTRFTLPYPPGHAMQDEDTARARGHKPNSVIQKETKRLADQLLKIAAAIRIDAIDRRTGTVTVEIANLATGHHLPAGFAFAREMWIEVSVNGKVVLGGKDDRELRADERLTKFGEEGKRLKNFQAVLWNGDEGELVNGVRHGETVLQNECVKVLKGKAAREHGFLDRQQFLEPGEIRSIDIDLQQNLRSSDEVQVRLLFRNYPPEFLEQLADRFRDETKNFALGPNCENAWVVDDDRANKAQSLISQLRIVEMARDKTPDKKTSNYQSR